MCHCYNVSLGIKGDTGDPGVRGPRGFIGKMCLHMYNIAGMLGRGKVWKIL